MVQSPESAIHAAISDTAGSSAERADSRKSRDTRDPAGDTTTEVMSKEKYDLVFDLLRNMRYHAAREAWFAGWSKFSQFLSVLFGTAAGVTLLSTLFTPEVRVFVSAALGFFVAIITTLNLVFDLSGAARLHAGIRQRFAAVLANIEAEPILDRTSIASARAEMAKIYGDEPPVKMAVDALAWNETRRSLASNLSGDDLIPIKWHQRILRHIFAFSDFDARTQGERA